ncbi:MAG: tRNA threonylcarbamoyladenosine biosynthesis protein TsaB [Paracoccaceae bacterium]
MVSDHGYILGFDTSAAHCAAALLCNGTIIATRHEEMAKGQAERLMGLLGDVLEDGGIGLSDLSALGVGIGPGNFTGIRISVAAARGLSLSLRIPAIGVSLLEVQAEGHSGPVLACLDARRGQIYLQGFGPGYDTTPTFMSVAALPSSGYAAANLTCVGTAAESVAGILNAKIAKPTYSEGVAIARIAARRLVQAAPQTLERPAPLYLRAADAAPPRDPAPLMLS